MWGGSQHFGDWVAVFEHLPNLVPVVSRLSFTTYYDCYFCSLFMKRCYLQHLLLLLGCEGFSSSSGPIWGGMPSYKGRLSFHDRPCLLIEQLAFLKGEERHPSSTWEPCLSHYHSVSYFGERDHPGSLHEILGVRQVLFHEIHSEEKFSTTWKSPINGRILTSIIHSK